MTTMSPTVTTSVTRTISEFRAAVNSSFVPLQVSCAHPDRFRGVIRAADADEIHFTDVQATDHLVERTPTLVARGDEPHFKVSLMLGGTGLLVQDGREAVLEPGDFAIYDTSRPYSLVFDDAFRTMVVMFKRHRLGVPADGISQMTAVRMPGRDPLNSVATAFLRPLGAHLDQLSGHTGARLAHTTLDLLTTVFSHELAFDRDPADPHQALRQRILDYIDRNIASTDLNPASIAGAHFISTRHLHALFQDLETTVSTWIRSQRLDRCRRDLANPLYMDRSVAAIAARWGFVDAAHFSRTFKTEFGRSPRELRSTH